MCLWHPKLPLVDFIPVLPFFHSGAGSIQAGLIHLALLGVLLSSIKVARQCGVMVGHAGRRMGGAEFSGPVSHGSHWGIQSPAHTPLGVLGTQAKETCVCLEGSLQGCFLVPGLLFLVAFLKAPHLLSFAELGALV